MTIAMLSLAGIPGTVGFIGKFQLIHALVNGDYTWLAIVLVIGSMISLGYYLRVVAAMWMSRPVPAPVPAPASGPSAAAGGLAPIAGGSPEADALQPSAAGGGSSGTAPRPTSDAAEGRSTRSPESLFCSAGRACSSGSSRRRCLTSPPTRATR